MQRTHRVYAIDQRVRFSHRRVAAAMMYGRIPRNQISSAAGCSRPFSSAPFFSRAAAAAAPSFSSYPQRRHRWWRGLLWTVAGGITLYSFLQSESPYKAYLASFWRRSPYPESVQAHLRSALAAEHGLLRALTSGDDPLVTAEMHYVAALKQCAALRLPPSSDAVTGIQIQYAALKEKQMAYAASLGILKEVFHTLQANLPRQQTEEERHATALKLVGIAQKIGDLHAQQRQFDDAEDFYIWGVEAMLTMAKRKENVAMGARPEVHLLRKYATELSPLLHAAASLYYLQKKAAAASRLYQLEFELIKERYPGRAMLVACNVAGALMEEGQLKEAKDWLGRAKAVGEEQGHAGTFVGRMWAFLRETPYQRDEIVLRHQGECILTNGYGKIYEMEGKPDKALQAYKESLALARRFQFAEGIAESARNVSDLEQARPERIVSA